MSALHPRATARWLKRIEETEVDSMGTGPVPLHRFAQDGMKARGRDAVPRTVIVDNGRGVMWSKPMPLGTGHTSDDMYAHWDDAHRLLTDLNRLDDGTLTGPKAEYLLQEMERGPCR